MKPGLISVNQHRFERVGRVGLGVALLLLLPAPWSWLGLVPITTGLVGWCPLYTLLGLNTCRTTR